MNENKLKFKLEDLKRALDRLEDSLNKDPHIDDLYLDGIEANSPRGTFRESFKVELIEDGTDDGK